MPFLEDGSSHHSGVKFETDAVYFINCCYLKNIDLFDLKNDIEEKIGSLGRIVCLHNGGTRSKSDGILLCTNTKQSDYCVFDISIKKHDRGTVDIINKSYSAFIKEYPNVFDPETDNDVYRILDSMKKDKIDNDYKKTIDERISKKILETLDSVTDASSFMDLTTKEFRKTDLLVIGTKFKNKIPNKVYVGKTKIMKVYNEEKVKGASFFLRKDTAKKSARIYVRTKDGQEHETPYRVRLSLNNGIRAYYNSKKGSILTVKIQVDKVIYLLNQMDCKDFIEYNKFLEKFGKINNERISIQTESTIK